MILTDPDSGSIQSAVGNHPDCPLKKGGQSGLIPWAGWDRPDVSPVRIKCYLACTSVAGRVSSECDMTHAGHYAGYHGRTSAKRAGNQGSALDVIQSCSRSGCTWLARLGHAECRRHRLESFETLAARTRPLPDWMQDPSLLPKKPPGRT